MSEDEINELRGLFEFYKENQGKPNRKSNLIDVKNVKK